MATTPATKKSKPTSVKPALTILKKASCPTLSLGGTIGYELLAADNGDILIGLTNNSGTGYFSKARQPLTAILNSLEDFASQYPLTSLALKDLYPDTSINSWGFLLAALVAEGLVEPLEDNMRHFRLCDPAPFLQQVDELKAKHQPKRASSASRKTKGEVAA